MRPIEPSECILVLVTAGSEEEAERIGRALVERQLAACANILPKLRSIFRWEGKVTEEKEFLLLIKSRHELFDEIAMTVKGLHSYQVPEIVSFRLSNGWPDYLNWIQDCTRKWQ